MVQVKKLFVPKGMYLSWKLLFLFVLLKKIMGGTKAYNKAIKEGLKVYVSRLKREENDRVEQERITRKRTKRNTYKERREAKRLEEEVKRKQKEREEQIEIQAEAYIRAMKCMNNAEQVKRMNYHYILKL